MKYHQPYNKSMQPAEQGFRVSRKSCSAAADLNSYTYQVKLAIVICALVLAQPSFACRAAKSGDEYNSLIRVEKQGESLFKLTFPQAVRELEYGATATVIYHTAVYKDGKPLVSGYPLELSLSGEDYVASIDLNKLSFRTAFVKVFWFPEAAGMCGAFGFSGNLR